ncbi:MAG: tetratricopeptide repeat protein, partial [Holophagales bacterium]|nr:tetratricopeptide repeat protein [Holophagales bacterium]
VLDAVALAHHHLRVHCDIKPSNILVTESGTPKLLDFGIAKLLSPEEQGQLTLTATGQRPMTPAYASPEQVLGEAITTATDLYSVGVLLYELLSGCLPYEMRADSDSDLRRAVVEQDPLPPSRCVAAGREPRRQASEPPPTLQAVAERRQLSLRELEQSLRGDLDAIILQAIRKEPGRRFRSAEAFADDIARYLEARPVRARQGTWRYLAARFARRLFFSPDPRRRRERLSWLAALLLLTSLSSLALWLRRPPPLCEDSEARLGEAWTVADRLAVKEAFIATDLPFATDTARRVTQALDTYAREWIATDTEICRATLVSGERSERLLDLGRLCLDGRREELRSLVSLLQQADAALAIEAVSAANLLGDLETCTNQAELAIRRTPPRDPAVRRGLERARTMVDAERLRLQLKQPVDLEALEQTEAQARELGDPLLLARSLFVSGQARTFEMGELQAGIENLEEALRAAIAGSDRPLQTRIYAMLVKAEARQEGDLERARFWESLALASLEALPPSYHDAAYAVFDALGAFQLEFGSFERSMELYQKALEQAELQGDSLLQVAALNSLGMGSSDQALRAIELLEQELGPNHVRLASPLSNLAATRASIGRYEEALPLLRRSAELARSTYGDDYVQLGYPLTLTGQVLVATDRPREALEPLEQALALFRGGLGAHSKMVRDVHVALSEAHLLLGLFERARDHMALAETSLELGVPSGEGSRLNLLRVRGDLERRAGELDTALATHEELLSQLGPLREQAPELAVWQVAAVAKTLLAVNRKAEARPLLEEAWEYVFEGDQRLGAEIALDLAEVVEDEDPEQALELVKASRARLSSELPLHRELLEAIAARWGQPAGAGDETAGPPSSRPATGAEVSTRP